MLTELKERLNTLAGLKLIEISSEQEVIDRLPGARAVVFEFDGTAFLYRARVRRIREAALRHGVMIVMVNGKGVPPEDFQLAIAQAFVSEVSYGPEYSPLLPVRAFQDDLCKMVHEIAIWPPGPPLNSSMKIRGEFNPNHEILLRRSFSDFLAIKVFPLTEGKSGAAVYTVTPLTQPWVRFIAKVDATERVAGEADRYFRYACTSVSFKNRPNFDKDRSIYTPDVSIVVEDFIDKARPIFDVLPNSTPAVLISSVFEGALRNWRREAKLEERKLSDVPLIREILDRRTPPFFVAAERAKKALKSPFEGAELLSACDKIEPIPCPWNRIHGDLHCGNIFVGTGSSDIVVFDFTKTEEGPAVLDPACLEVDLVFNRIKPFSGSLARIIYGTPLKVSSLDTVARTKHDWLLDSVRAIRMFGLTELNRRAYTFAIACYLVRHASFEDSGTPRSRALATYIASRLVDYLLNEKR